MWQYVKSILKGPPSERQRQKDRSELQRKLVTRFFKSHGAGETIVRLGGTYLTQRQADERMKRVLKYNFGPNLRDRLRDYLSRRQHRGED